MCLFRNLPSLIGTRVRSSVPCFVLVLALVWGLVPDGGVAQNEITAEASPAQRDSTTPPDLCEAPVEAIQQARTEVRSAFTGGSSEKVAAADAYMYLLGCLDDPDSAARIALRQDVAQHLLLMTDDERRHVLGPAAESDRDLPESVDLEDDAGSYLQAWWRRHDPVPATRGNERLVEHLDRVTLAEGSYRWPDRVDGLDDRGRVYVRFGPPMKRVKLDVRDQPRLVEYMSRPGIRQGALHASEFPRSEAWLYNMNRDSYYLFVEKERLKDRYVIGKTMDLLPAALRRPHATPFTRRSARVSDPRGLIDGDRAGGPRKVILWRSMRWIYKELNYFHPSFHSRLHNLDSNIGIVGESATEQPTWRILQEAVRVADAEEAEIAKRRDETMPPHQTNVHDALPGLPVAWRTSRFLDDDGETTTQVAWGIEPGGLQRNVNDWEEAGTDAPVSSDGYLLMATAAKYDRAFQRDVMFRQPLFAPSLAAETSEPLSWKSFMLAGRFTFADSLCVSVQWDVRPATLSETGGINIEDQVLSRQVAPIDTLTALSNTPGVLEMSDVMPVHANELAELDGERPTAYPFRTIGPEMPVALYFELYELAQENDGQTRYTVTYEIKIRQPQRGITRWFRPDSRTNVSTEATYRGSQSKSREYLQLDLGSLEIDDRAELSVIVRVLDDVSGQMVSRSMPLEWRP